MTRAQASQKAREARAVSQERERKKITRKALEMPLREIALSPVSDRQLLYNFLAEMRWLIADFEKRLHDSEPD